MCRSGYSDCVKYSENIDCRGFSDSRCILGPLSLVHVKNLKEVTKMNVRYLLPAFAAVTLVILSQTQSGWTADSFMQPQSLSESYYMQPQSPTEVNRVDYSTFADSSPKKHYRMQPQSEVLTAGYSCTDDTCSSADYCAEPQPPAKACGTDNGCCPNSCSDKYKCTRWEFFGEFLYLRPLNAGVEYAVPFNGPISAGQVPLEMGRTASVNPSFSPGFRAGGAFWLDDCATIGAAFSHYENNVNDAIATNAPTVIRSMVIHPSSLDADADWLAASAHQYIRFDLADIEYRRVFYTSESSTINYLVGLRYANLKQQFDSQFESIITENVNTQIDFEGGGFRLGLEAAHEGRCNFSVYSKAYASFLGGEFRGSYLQSSTVDPVIAQTDWKEARFVSILDCEVGIGWRSCNGRVRASAGYQVSGWMNVVKTGEFISSVQANKYHGPDKINGNGLVFDGLVANIEYNW